MIHIHPKVYRARQDVQEGYCESRYLDTTIWNLLHSIDSNWLFGICLLVGIRIELNHKFMKILRPGTNVKVSE
jgi:hypothetical protein